jgi:hypothetical protein
MRVRWSALIRVEPLPPSVCAVAVVELGLGVVKLWARLFLCHNAAHLEESAAALRQVTNEGPSEVWLRGEADISHSAILNLWPVRLCPRGNQLYVRTRSSFPKPPTMTTV